MLMITKKKVFSIGAYFFIASCVYAQKKQDTIKTRAIDEVVMVGYGAQKKKEVTGSISKIQGSDISNLVTPSFESQIAGRASGVQITTNNGVVGEAPRIRIRGINSINSSSYPLIVVDGIPIFTGDTGGYASTNALGDINPADIESYTILKDGAATAVYGSRAANGVIVITTKRGKQGKTTLGYNTYTGFASVVKRFDLLKTNDFITINNEKKTNRGLAPTAFGTQYDTDWQKAILRTALQTDHNFNITGGLGKGSYYASFGYNKTEGVTIANEMQRYTARLNADQSVTDWLKVGTNLSVTSTSYTGMNVGASNLSGSILNAIKQLPNTPVYDPNGPFGYNIKTIGTNTIVGNGQNLENIANNLPNIRYVLDNNKQNSAVTRIIANAYADIKLLPSLTFRTQASVDRSETEGFLYYNPFHGDGRSSNGRIQNSTTKLQRYNWQNILTFNKNFGNHNVVFTGVNEYQKQDVYYYFGGGTDLANAFFNQNVISGSYGTLLSGGGKSNNALTSLMGRLNYNFAKRYFIQASLRRDKLSKFAPDKRAGIFPGASAGWTISNENFMSSISWINDLKIRGSYGKVGNTEIGGDYPYLGLYGLSKYGDLNGIGLTQMRNNVLSWETSIKKDIGIDFAMFNNRLKITADYFINDIDNLILDVPVAVSMGVPGNQYKDNIGRSLNKGFELAIDWSPIRKDNIELNINSNISFINNQVKTLNKGQDLIYDYNIVREGESINALYGFKYWGVNPSNGNPVYYLQDGSLVQGNISTNSYRVFNPNDPTNISVAGKAPDRFILGNTMPKYFGAFNISFKYHSFDISTLTRFSGGNYIMNATRREMLSQFFNNNSTEILGRWQSPTNPGDGITPRLWSGADPIVNGASIANSRFVEKGDFIKLDNITLGYSFPKSLADRINIQKMRLFIQAQNALIITKYKGIDPEMESAGLDYNGTPRTSVYSVGLNVTL